MFNLHGINTFLPQIKYVIVVVRVKKLNLKRSALTVCTVTTKTIDHDITAPYMQHRTCSTIHAVIYMQYYTCINIHAAPYMQHHTSQTLPSK